jgi:hypothetical protein
MIRILQPRLFKQFFRQIKLTSILQIPSLDQKILSLGCRRLGS